MRVKWWIFLNRIVLAFVTMVVVASARTVLEFIASGALLAVVMGLSYVARKSASLRELALLEEESQQSKEKEKVRFSIK